MFHNLIKPKLDWVLFLLIYFKTWLNCASQSYCNNLPYTVFAYDHIEPIEISSAGEAVKIYYNLLYPGLILNVEKIEFEHNSAEGPIIDCRITNITQNSASLLVNCDTTPISSSMTINHQFNSSLTLLSQIRCENSYGDTELKQLTTSNSSRLIDPHITNLPPYIFYNYTTIFELVYLVKHPRHNIQLESHFTQCNQLYSTANRTRFACNYFRADRVQALEFNVKINGKNFKKFACNVFLAPVLNEVVGSTFDGANVPIQIIGNHFNEAFSKHIYLKTNLTTFNCQLVSLTSIRCRFGFGIKPVKVKTQVSFTVLFNELTEFTNQSLSLTVDPNPIVTSIVYSFSENLFYAYFVNFNTHYKAFTNFRIFDPNRKDYMSCAILPENRYNCLICRPWAKLSEKGFNQVHVNIEIGLWIVSYRDVARLETGLDFSLIQIYIGLSVSAFVSLSFITFVCYKLANPRRSKLQKMKITSTALRSLFSIYLRKKDQKLKERPNKKSDESNKNKLNERAFSPQNLKKAVKPEKVIGRKNRNQKLKRKK